MNKALLILLIAVLLGGSGGLIWWIRHQSQKGDEDPTPDPPSAPPKPKRIQPSTDSNGKLINLIVGTYRSGENFNRTHDVGFPGLTVKDGDRLNFTNQDFIFDVDKSEYTLDLAAYKGKSPKVFTNFTAAVTPDGTVKIRQALGKGYQVYTFTPPSSGLNSFFRGFVNGLTLGIV